MIKFFCELNHELKEIFGGKACNLAKLDYENFNVPPGFVVSSCIVFDEQNKKRILRCFDNLRCEKVSVRSSMSLEDENKNSFAGLFRSFLNVDKKNLMNTIKKCIESVNEDRVKEYCFRRGIDYNALNMAVVVQQMIPAERAGVIFTRDPTGKTDDLVIETAFGRCEDVVSGKVNLVRYNISKTDFFLGTMQGNFILTRDEIMKLIELSLDIEDRFGVPQDIEWCIDYNKRIWILQTRPITTLDCRPLRKKIRGVYNVKGY